MSLIFIIEGDSTYSRHVSRKIQLMKAHSMQRNLNHLLYSRVSTNIRTNFESTRFALTNRIPPYFCSQRHLWTVACQRLFKDDAGYKRKEAFGSFVRNESTQVCTNTCTNATDRCFKLCH